MFRTLLLVAPATLICFAAATPQAAETDPTLRTEQYYVAAGKTYNMHANDHARMLAKYAAASKKPVPSDVVREHVKAIEENLQHARDSFAKLSPMGQNDEKVGQQLSEIEKRLGMLTGQIDSLKKVAADEAVDSTMIAKETNQMMAHMKATHQAGKEIDSALAAQMESREKFYDPNASSYYFTGEGHFID